MMAARSLFFLSLTIANAVTAFERAVMITPTLNERAVSLPGGWGANEYNGTCPAGATSCFIGGCCPNALTCLGTGDPVNVICCPENMSETDCENIFSPNPICADSSWTLWNSTTQGQYGGFFCCDEDQIGDQLGGCFPPSETSSDTVSKAITVTPATISGAVSATTTTKNVGGYISSLVASVTGKESSSATGTSATGTSASATAKSSSAAASDHHDLKWGGITGVLGCLFAVLL